MITVQLVIIIVLTQNNNHILRAKTFHWLAALMNQE